MPVGEKRQPIVVHLKRLQDGACSNPRAELMACMLADGFTIPEAWSSVPGENGKVGKNDGGSMQYRKKITADPVFKARVEELVAQKAEMEQDKIWGKAEWAANQVYRMAVAKQDIATMSRASGQLMQIAEKRQAGGQSSGSPPPKADAGAPAVTGSAGRADAAEKRRKLLQKAHSEPISPE